MLPDGSRMVGWLDLLLLLLTKTLSSRSEPHPEGPGRDDSEPDGGLGPGGVHGLRLAAAGGHPHPAVGPGRRARNLQVSAALVVPAPTDSSGRRHCTLMALIIYIFIEF